MLRDHARVELGDFSISDSGEITELSPQTMDLMKKLVSLKNPGSLKNQIV